MPRLPLDSLTIYVARADCEYNENCQIHRGSSNQSRNRNNATELPNYLAQRLFSMRCIAEFSGRAAHGFIGRRSSWKRPRVAISLAGSR
jgi:hypothetical protein